MMPALPEGDRLPVDTVRRIPAIGGMFVLRDGGLVVGRVAPVPDDGSALGMRLKPANPNHTRPAEDIDIVGKVLWTVRRA